MGYGHARGETQDSKKFHGLAGGKRWRKCKQVQPSVKCAVRQASKKENKFLLERVQEDPARGQKQEIETAH